MTTSAVHLWPEMAGHPMHAMHEEKGAREEARTAWVYFSGVQPTANTVGAAKGGKKAARTYTNEDVQRQNQNNGNVKMKGKSEKL